MVRAVVWVIENRDNAIKRGIRPIASLSKIPLHQADYTNKFSASGAATLGLNATCHFIRSTANPTVELMSAEMLNSLSRSATVVTGIGLVTPIGQDFETFEHRLFAGQSAVAPHYTSTRPHFQFGTHARSAVRTIGTPYQNIITNISED